MRRKHYRCAIRIAAFDELSITVPCNTWGINLTRDTTKDASLVTCKKCLQFLATIEHKQKTMKITYTHHRNSQLHVIPVQPGHVTSCICPCGPKLKMNNGHLMVDHKSGRGFKGKWRGEVKNYGVKLLDKKGNPL